jgi:hypothetical protein
MEGTIKVAQDATMPVGRCLVVRISDHALIYSGRIGGLTEDVLERPGALLILHPTDFADGEAFFKKMLN